MDFYIKQKSTLPILKLELVNDGRNDFRKLYYDIQNSDIFFNMYDAQTGKKVLGMKRGELFQKIKQSDSLDEEFYIGYTFSEKDTSKPGRYIGEFIIKFSDGNKLIVPIKDILYIHII
jgi:hypothetical protein